MLHLLDGILDGIKVRRDLKDFFVFKARGVITFFFCSFISIGCADVSLEVREEPEVIVYSKDSFCIVDPLEVAGGALKIMFVVDVSGSNQSNDSNGSKRADNIDEFVQSLAEEGGAYQYGLIRFDGSVEPAISYPDDSQKARFTDDLEELFEATDTIRKKPAVGGTQYGMAIQAAKVAIETDIEEFPDERSSYVVLFISDGQPNDFNLNFGVSDLVNVNGGDVYLSTAYYGSSGNQAVEILRDMAVEGGGNFVNFEDGEHWDLEGLLIEPDVIPWSLKEFLVYNLNAGFCLDGRVDVDSDVDGMCDRDELKMNRLYADELKAEGKSFDPTNRFSFGDGYGDFFHWLRFRYPGKTLPECEDRSDEDFDLLTVCEEGEIESQTDEGIINGDPESFDTDKDGLIDGIETFVYFASQNTGRTTRYTAALDEDNIKDNPDGEESVLVQIKEHRNPWFEDPHAEAYDTRISPLGSALGDCYDFSQSSLSVYETLRVKEGNTLPGLEHGSGENSVMVYYIQVLQSRPKAEGILKYSIQKINWGQLSPGLKVQEGIFSEYIPPKKD